MASEIGLDNNFDEALANALRVALDKNVEVTIAIVDDGGFLWRLIRTAGATKGSVQVAIEKARTSALFVLPTDILENLACEHPPVMRIPDAVPLTGGLPIIRDGKCVGAVGVAGAQAADDLAIAQTAVTALG